MGLKARISVHPRVSPLSLRGAEENRARLLGETFGCRRSACGIPAPRCSLVKCLAAVVLVPNRPCFGCCVLSESQPWICVIALFVVTTPIPLSCSCNSERVTNVVLLRLFVLLTYHVGKSLARIHPRGPSRDIIVSKQKASAASFVPLGRINDQSHHNELFIIRTSAQHRQET